MTTHSYISKAQSTYLMNQKENLDSDICIMIFDIAETYHYVLQDEIQSFHWNDMAAFTLPLFIIKMRQMSFKKSHLILYQKI